MIFFIGDSYCPGTPGENRFDGLCRGIAHQGYAITRVFLRPNANRQIAKDNNTGVHYIYLWERKRFRAGKFRHIQQILWLVNFLLTVKPEDKIVVTNSDYLFVYSWFHRLNIYHEKSEFPELNLDRKSWIARQEFKSYISTCKKLDGIFPISNALKDYFVIKGIKKERLQVVNMTVDPARFVSLKKESVREKYIAYCGAVSNDKDGVDILIKAFSIVAKRIENVKLYIIGKFPFKKDEEVDRVLVESLGLNDRVLFTGEVQREDMPQLLKNAEVLVLARPDNVQAKYGFPTKLGEYLLTENPVVVTRVGDIPRFLTDGENAYIADPGNVKDIASKLIEALTSEKAREIGLRGASEAMKSFNSETESKKIVKFVYGK